MWGWEGHWVGFGLGWLVFGEKITLFFFVAALLCLGLIPCLGRKARGGVGVLRDGGVCWLGCRSFPIFLAHFFLLFSSCCLLSWHPIIISYGWLEGTEGIERTTQSDDIPGLAWNWTGLDRTGLGLKCSFVVTFLCFLASFTLLLYLLAPPPSWKKCRFKCLWSHGMFEMRYPVWSGERRRWLCVVEVRLAKSGYC